MIPKFKAIIKNGKVKVYQKDLMEMWIASIPEEKEVWVQVCPAKKNRSSPQNNYLWGVVYALISGHTGYTPEEVHEAMKLKFLRKYTDSPLPSLRSTTELSTAEFEDYVEKIRQWGSTECNLVIPSPNDFIILTP